MHNSARPTVTEPPHRRTRRAILGRLYGDRADAVMADLDALIARHPRRRPSPPWDERTAWMIAYPGQFRLDEEAPLAALRSMMVQHLEPAITGVHVLPVHPSSSDGGFSITDFERIDPAHGSWDDFADLAASTTVMADAVLNHASAQGRWFEAFLAGEPPFDGFFRELDLDADLSAVVRPRSSPLVTTFRRPDGEAVSVWTTFSADQVDLDYRAPEVLVAMTEVVLRYVSAGARAVRLDAVAFLWKLEGSPSINLAETHDIVRLLRACIDEVDPGVILVTETNLPHEENVSYFGPAGVREAQAVYQFPLPPLVLHSFLSENVSELRAWADSLDVGRDDTTFLNFLGSHDGVGLRPVEGLLEPWQRVELEDACRGSGGIVNMRQGPDGVESPYELTGTWYSLLGGAGPDSAALDRHLASHAIALALRGIPLLYAHSLFASANDTEALARTGHGRDLNRSTLTVPGLPGALADPGSRAARSWLGMARMLSARRSSPAFHPQSSQEIVDGPENLLIVRRRSPAGDEALVIVNVSSHERVTSLPAGPWKTFDEQEVGPHAVRVGGWSSLWLRSAGP